LSSNPFAGVDFAGGDFTDFSLAGSVFEDVDFANDLVDVRFLMTLGDEVVLDTFVFFASFPAFGVVVARYQSIQSRIYI
jgi:hypothetical protein